VTVIETALQGVRIVEPRVFRDERGAFAESWRADRYREAGLETRFVQDNVSFSRAGVLRGLHYQHPSDQAKLVTALTGRILDIAVDVRRGSPTFGRWVGVELSGDSLRQLFIPEGFAHGFFALEDALVSYKCSRVYTPEHERSIRWDDPELAIEWPAEAPFLSPKDAAAPLLAELEPGSLPS
jgi:dTDP-4-dehydrorhamnose 3,5-epimerase